jgi:hypothetical protein
MSPRLRAEDLRRFTGDEVRYRHPFGRVIFTEGVKYVADVAGAYWLIDAIASYFGSPKMSAAIARDERLAWMQFWKLHVDNEQRGKLVCQADAGEPASILQAIPYTDFPLELIEIWAAFDGRLWTLYLPSEH